MTPSPRCNRLFVPLASDPYRWFQSGRKHWELRKNARQFSKQHIWPGRLVELRRGYRDSHSAIWGEIVDVEPANGLDNFFDRVDWKDVLPECSDRQSAIEAARHILNLEEGSDTPVVGFKIKVRDRVTLPMKSEFLELVRNGTKRSTVRAGSRRVPTGPAQLVSGPNHISVSITGVKEKPFGMLDEHDAATDGFDSVAALRDALLQFYPELTEVAPVTIVHFVTV